MGSKVVAFLVLSLNLLFVTMVSSQDSPPPPDTDAVTCLIAQNLETFALLPPSVGDLPLPDVPVNCCGPFVSLGPKITGYLCSIINTVVAKGQLGLNPAAAYNNIITTCGLSNSTGGYQCTSN